MALVTNIVSSTRLLPHDVVSPTPHSGPKRYDYSDERDDWLYSRDGVVLSDLLNREISQIVGRRVDLRIESISTHVE